MQLRSPATRAGGRREGDGEGLEEVVGGGGSAGRHGPRVPDLTSHPHDVHEPVPVPVPARIVAARAVPSLTISVSSDSTVVSPVKSVASSTVSTAASSVLGKMHSLSTEAK